MTIEEAAGKIDHTFLKPYAEPGACEAFLREAAELPFACAMVHPSLVQTAVRALRRTCVRVGTVIGFPLGQNTARIKRAEADEAVKLGARDLDFVINVKLLKAAARGDAKARDALSAELDLLSGVHELADGIVTKLILECCALTDEEKIAGVAFARAAGFDFVKTSTGFAAGGATVQDVVLLKRAAGNAIRVKAAGGIRDAAVARALLAAGADRLGCSSGYAMARALIENQPK